MKGVVVVSLCTFVCDLFTENLSTLIQNIIPVFTTHRSKVLDYLKIWKFEYCKYGYDHDMILLISHSLLTVLS